MKVFLLYKRDTISEALVGVYGTIEAASAARDGESEGYTFRIEEKEVIGAEFTNAANSETIVKAEPKKRGRKKKS